MTYVATALEERKILKVFIKYNAFTPDKAIDFKDFLTELAKLEGSRPWARPYAEFRILGIWGVKKIDNKIYLDVREYLLKWSLAYLIAWVGAICIILIPPWLLHPTGVGPSAVVTVVIAATLVAVPLALLAFQPLLSHIIASKIRRSIKRRG